MNRAEWLSRRRPKTPLADWVIGFVLVAVIFGMLTHWVWR